MKKISILSLLTLCLGVFIFSFSSCNKAKMPKADLKTELDSLAYGIGVANGNGMRQQLSYYGIDSVYLDSFIQGLLEGASVTDSQKIAYSMGFQSGQRFSDESFKQSAKSLFGGDTTKVISKEAFMAGFIAEFLKKDPKMDSKTASEYVDKVMARIQNEQAEKLYADNKAAGVKFLEENKSKEGVIILPDGLQYKVIKEGKGPKPTSADRVKVNYKGTLIDGTEFDSSYSRPEPTILGVTQVIPGWTEALLMMPVGSKWILYVPQELAYGAQDGGKIKPFSTLIFEMELLEIVPSTPAPNQIQVQNP